MRKFELNGMFVPHVTPFTSTGEVDVDGLRTCLRFWLEGGVSGLVPCGSNGEAPYLSRDERRVVIAAAVEEANGKVPVVAGTGSMSTQETIIFTKDAAELGADAALVVTPFYFKLSNREIIDHYKTILDAIDFPVIVYNVPKFTGFSIDPSVVYKLASQNQRVIGVKDSSGNFGNIIETIRLTGSGFSVLAGTADLALPTLMSGGKGAVIAVANVFPALSSRLYNAFKQGRFDEAKDLQNKIAYANEVLVKKFNQLSAIKEAMRLQGLPSGYPRKPALPLEGEESKVIENMLRTFDATIEKALD